MADRRDNNILVLEDVHDIAAALRLLQAAIVVQLPEVLVAAVVGEANL